MMKHYFLIYMAMVNLTCCDNISVLELFWCMPKFFIDKIKTNLRFIIFILKLSMLDV
ncbi:hypothetical protein Tthe_1822 [Thermoanaerobacterium thermosaccharolyticum DSM 571]|uniref:Uncharacterized protein n=1 Tax=Thermoanaerobacterium thermosaccharolyticum (strain ATCC 7956 / DSM 571 / NCIMB 9385 / NCA 3814 / NCTC 13789 / WDCM 00135 / 2032) TaxID=580327 RepID=D9TR65_THETC|nr:hypothetical protein Tthe_1822 [Thermoanaerobacterium thermosaccharolyticum DSM 571]MCP2240830.1 hypothetical protein [Thermoanaerobacterium thermosaccharolyticum]